MAQPVLPRVGGFRFGAVASGIKKRGGLDLGLIVADRPAVTAGVLTKNLVRAAPVDVAAERLRGGRAQAVLVNSGNANACTGAAGLLATLRSTDAAAEALGIPARRILPASTGVIGVLLPDRRIVEAMPELVASLSSEGATAFAQAICTTDRWPKTAATTFTVGRRRSTVLGIAKGAGMIHPNMATTLGFVVLDAPVRASALKRALREAVEESFNRMSVDGDTSTNDVIFVLSSGALGGAPIDGAGLGARKLRGVLTDVLESLGEQIVADGEGAEHLVRIEVDGASNDDAALRVARAIATSQLVKTALHGCDPNWGRIVAAAGRAGVRFDPSDVRVDIGDVRVFERGVPVMDGPTEKRAAAVMKGERYVIRARIGSGRGRAWYTTCDLGHEYVRINADYRS